MSPSPLVPARPLGAAYIPILLSEVEQEKRPSGNGDREAIVVGAGLFDGEGERAYTDHAPRYYMKVHLDANKVSKGERERDYLQANIRLTNSQRETN